MSTETLTGTAYVAAFIRDRCAALKVPASERRLAAATKARPGDVPCPTQAWWQQRLQRGVYDEPKPLRTMPEDRTLVGFARALKMTKRDARRVFEVAMGVGQGEPQRLRDLRGGVQPKTTRDLVFQEP